ncbi:hypothetical protein [Neobacillus sp. Marseille-QA0830]
MKELFDMNGREFSVQQAKLPQRLTVTVERFDGLAQQVRINFIKKRFVYVEWNAPPNHSEPMMNLPFVQLGCIEEFKTELNSFNIWDWEPIYQKENGVILEGRYWIVELQTKEKIYKWDGVECFPNNWARFCRSIEKLVGLPFGR